MFVNLWQYLTNIRWLCGWQDIQIQLLTNVFFYVCIVWLFSCSCVCLFFCLFVVTVALSSPDALRWAVVTVSPPPPHPPTPPFPPIHDLRTVRRKNLDFDLGHVILYVTSLWLGIIALFRWHHFSKWCHSGQMPSLWSYAITLVRLHHFLAILGVLYLCSGSDSISDRNTTVMFILNSWHNFGDF